MDTFEYTFKTGDETRGFGRKMVELLTTAGLIEHVSEEQTPLGIKPAHTVIVKRFKIVEE